MLPVSLFQTVTSCKNLIFAFTTMERVLLFFFPVPKMPNVCAFLCLVQIPFDFLNLIIFNFASSRRGSIHAYVP